MGWLSIDNNARTRYIKQTSNVTEISIPRTINSPSKFDIMLFNKNPQHHHIIFQAQKRKSNYNGMQKRKKNPWQNLQPQVCIYCLNLQ